MDKTHLIFFLKSLNFLQLPKNLLFGSLRCYRSFGSEVCLFLFIEELRESIRYEVKQSFSTQFVKSSFTGLNPPQWSFSPSLWNFQAYESHVFLTFNNPSSYSHHLEFCAFLRLDDSVMLWCFPSCQSPFIHHHP